VPLDARVPTHRAIVVSHLERAGGALERRQIEAAGALRGSVSPTDGGDQDDFVGTLMAVWVWARHQTLSGQSRFEASREAAWRYVREAGVARLPEQLEVGDVAAPFAAACLLRAALADREAGSEVARQAIADLACQALHGYLGGLERGPGRGAADAGFWVMSLADYARASDEERALRAAVEYADRHFGLRTPPEPMAEPQGTAPRDFFSTAATQVLAQIATQGETPFLGAWLRERVLPVLPAAFVPRARDEHAWNASLAWLLGAGYTMTHEVRFLDGYFAILKVLSARDTDGDGALGVDAGSPSFETLATWAWATAMDAVGAASSRVGT